MYASCVLNSCDAFSFKLPQRSVEKRTKESKNSQIWGPKECNLKSGTAEQKRHLFLVPLRISLLLIEYVICIATIVREKLRAI
jgi:hypothetical protein